MSRSLREQMDDALRELSSAERAWVDANQRTVNVRAVPLAELHRVQDAKALVTELATQLYPEGT
jgi:hypothetical protein